MFLSGPVLDHFEDCDSPIDVYLKFMDNFIIDNILYQTNLYITQKSVRAKPIDRQEFFGFIGVNSLMGYHKFPYWSQEPDLGVSFASTILSRNRFSEISSNLHVNDNLSLPKNNNDHLYELHSLLDSINDRCLKLYNISRRISIDESMILPQKPQYIKAV